MINKEKPQKISKLLLAGEMGFSVPRFLIISKIDIDNMEVKISEIIDFFKKNKIGSIIIRSASSFEDLERNIKAGFFDSSKDISIDDLKKEDFLYIWNTNLKKNKNRSDSLFLFVQEYIYADFFGVLFTQLPCDKNYSKISLSSNPMAITSGHDAEIDLVFSKKNNIWMGNGQLSVDVQDKLANIILKIDKKFIFGCDVELGIKEDNIYIFQIRPIKRNDFENVFYKENIRLNNIFGNEFEEQYWERNDFIQTIGDLDDMSLDFYNNLFDSLKFHKIILNAGIAKKYEKNKKPRILENIGGKTYFNLTQGDYIFYRSKNKIEEFIRLIIVFYKEKFFRKYIEIYSKGTISIDESFGLFFVSGFYYRFFLGIDRNKYSKDEFLVKLKNTERITFAREPFPEGLDEKVLGDFIKRYYFIAEDQYSLISPRISERSFNEVFLKYSQSSNNYINIGEEKDIANNYLSKNVEFWLEQKVYWKERFLKDIFEYRNKMGIIPENEKKLVNSDENFNNLSFISPINFPFGNIIKKEDVIICQGFIDHENAVKISEKDDIEKYFNKTIIISKFPSKWIPLIKNFKGIIIFEGNELSHMAITCREYNIPCIIKRNLINETFKD